MENLGKQRPRDTDIMDWIITLRMSKKRYESDADTESHWLTETQPAVALLPMLLHTLTMRTATAV